MSQFGHHDQKNTEERTESVYGNVIVIVIRILDPGNLSRCDLLHLRGVVSGAVHFVDAAGGYSDVDTCCAARFVAGTCALRFVTSRTPRCRSARLGCPVIACLLATTEREIRPFRRSSSGKGVYSALSGKNHRAARGLVKISPDSLKLK